MKKLLLLPLLVLMFVSCENNTGSFTEKNHAIINFCNASDYYAKVYLDASEYCNILPGVTKQYTYSPDNFDVHLKITLHEINGDKYNKVPEKELERYQKFNKGMSYKITITNNHISCQSTNSY